MDHSARYFSPRLSVHDPRHQAPSILLVLILPGRTYTAKMDAKKPVVKLCADGMKAEMEGKPEEARQLFLRSIAGGMRIR